MTGEMPLKIQPIGKGSVAGQKAVMDPLPVLVRLYIYGIQGFCDEVIFTSLFDFIVGANEGSKWQLKGHSSISTFLISCSCMFFTERLYIYLYYIKGVPRYLRMPLYVIVAYTFEFSWGIMLRYFDACPWDYSHYTYNFMGLITLWYAPGWLVLAWWQDVMADYLLRVRVPPAVRSDVLQVDGREKKLW